MNRPVFTLTEENPMRFLLISLCALVVTACAGNKPKPTGEPTETSSATATLESKSGSSVTGTGTFTQREGQVTLELAVENAPPGTHAVHLHEKGDCSAEDATSAGAHWNPTGSSHGHFGHNGFHLGDIGNLEVAEDGTGRLTFTTDKWTLGGGAETDILNKALIVHAAQDDFQTQPTGNAGGRIACAVVQQQ